MLNIITIMTTRAVSKSLTKPMKILNLIKNLLTIFSILCTGIMILFFVNPLKDEIPMIPNGIDNWYLGAFFGALALIVIPSIQLFLKHFTTLDVPLNEKTQGKLRRKLIKKDYKLSKKTNMKITKQLNKKDVKSSQKDLKKQTKQNKKESKK